MDGTATFSRDQMATAAQKIDWTSLLTKLKPETLAAVNAFRRRHSDLAKQIADLKEQQKPIDFARYRSSLKNTAVVDSAEKAWTSFKPAKFDVAEQLRIIEQQESKAINAAKATEAKVKAELVELGDLLKNIETARPLEELTVDEVVKILPEIDTHTAALAKRGQWIVPGYYEKFGEVWVSLTRSVQIGFLKQLASPTQSPCL